MVVDSHDIRTKLCTIVQLGFRWRGRNPKTGHENPRILEMQSHVPAQLSQNKWHQETIEPPEVAADFNFCLGRITSTKHTQTITDSTLNRFAAFAARWECRPPSRLFPFQIRPPAMQLWPTELARFMKPHETCPKSLASKCVCFSTLQKLSFHCQVWAHVGSSVESSNSSLGDFLISRIVFWLE